MSVEKNYGKKIKDCRDGMNQLSMIAMGIEYSVSKFEGTDLEKECNAYLKSVLLNLGEIEVICREKIKNMVYEQIKF